MMTYNRGIRSEAIGLPRGWIREEIPRNSGSISSVGNRRVDIYYISPSGHRIRSKPELTKYLGNSLDLTYFDFHSGKMVASKRPNNGNASSHNKLHGGLHNGPNSLNNGVSSGPSTDNSLVPPIRQTASIFKQPVTVHKNHKEEEKVKSDSKGNSNIEKPRQLFWEKRLSGLRASYPEEIYEPFSLPPNFTPVGPEVKQDIVLASIATILHMGNGSINGQLNATAKNVDKNPAVYINPDQPLIAGITISESDLAKQEAKVAATRKELEEALNALDE